MFYLVLLRLLFLGFWEFLLKLIEVCLCYQKTILICQLG